MSTVKETCDICVENINLVNKKITCIHCVFSSCMRCAKRYITSESSASCMSCKKEWNDDFLDANFPKSFLNKEYKNHIEGIEFAKQEALLPQTMLVIENEKKKAAILRQIFALKDQIAELEFEYNRIGTTVEVPKSSEMDEPKVSVIKQCPSDKCNGYLNSKYKCGICDLVVCTKCEQIKAGDVHTCDSSDIDTVKMKKKECKYCPNCSRETFKDGGCYQSWCPPPCNGGKGTAWDFNTGKVDKGGVHAPLYYQYMRENRVNENNGCRGDDELVEMNAIDYQIRTKRLNVNRHSFEMIYYIHRSITDVKYHLMSKYETIDDTFETHVDIRLKFLKNEITKESFNKTLMMRLKAKKKKQMIYENLEMLENVIVDIFHRLYTAASLAPRNSLFDLSPYLVELEKIREYYNVSILKTKKRFAIKGLDVGYMNENWEMKRVV